MYVCIFILQSMHRCWFIHCTVVPMACLVYSPAVGHVGWKAIHLLNSGPQMLSCRLRDLIPASDLAVYADAPLIWCLSELHPTNCVQWPCWTSTQSFSMKNRYAHSRELGSPSTVGICCNGCSFLTYCELHLVSRCAHWYPPSTWLRTFSTTRWSCWALLSTVAMGAVESHIHTLHVGKQNIGGKNMFHPAVALLGLLLDCRLLFCSPWPSDHADNTYSTVSLAGTFVLYQLLCCFAMAAACLGLFLWNFRSRILFLCALCPCILCPLLSFSLAFTFNLAFVPADMFIRVIRACPPPTYVCWQLKMAVLEILWALLFRESAPWLFRWPQYVCADPACRCMCCWGGPAVSFMRMAASTWSGGCALPSRSWRASSKSHVGNNSSKFCGWILAAIVLWGSQLWVCQKVLSSVQTSRPIPVCCCLHTLVAAEVIVHMGVLLKLLLVASKVLLPLAFQLLLWVLHLWALLLLFLLLKACWGRSCLGAPCMLWIYISILQTLRSRHCMLGVSASACVSLPGARSLHWFAVGDPNSCVVIISAVEGLPRCPSWVFPYAPYCSCCRFPLLLQSWSAWLLPKCSCCFADVAAPPPCKTQLNCWTTVAPAQAVHSFCTVGTAGPSQAEGRLIHNVDKHHKLL